VAADLSEFARKPRHVQKHPTGWEPGVAWNGQEGVITTLSSGEPDPAMWQVLIEDWGLDPLRTEVVDGSLQIRAWDTTRDGETIRMKYYRASIKARTSTIDRADVEALCKLVEKRKPKPVETHDGGRAFVVALSDWQLGKGEGGGTEATVERILGAFDRAVARAKELRKVGRGTDTVVLASLGDIVEGCSGWYAMQEWQTDLNQREQDRLARRLLLTVIDAFVDAQFMVVAPCVPGNHGENRKDGKAFTDFSDNRDVSCFETVAEIMAANPSRYENVTVPLGAINPDDLTATLKVGGIPLALAHGHQFRTGGSTQAKVEGWWKGQALGRTGVADAEILLAGHGHHFMMSESTGRTVIQAPAMDGGSKWWTSTTGQSSPAGMLTLNVGVNAGLRGWGDLQIL